MSKHTPAPWKMTTDVEYIDGDKNSPTGQIEIVGEDHLTFDKDGWTVCKVYVDRTVDEANARLIAAAPEMLEALKAGLQRLKELQDATGYPTAFVQIQFEEAIKKAEGR